MDIFSYLCIAIIVLNTILYKLAKQQNPFKHDDNWSRITRITDVLVGFVMFVLLTSLLETRIL